MNYYAYINYSEEIVCYVIFDVPEQDIKKYYKTIPCKIIKSFNKEYIINDCEHISMGRLQLVQNKKIIAELNKLMVFQ